MSSTVHYGERFVENLPFENTPYGFRKRLRFILEAIHRQFPDPSRQLNVLEVGCGTGKLIAIPLAQYGCRVTGIDVHRESIEYAATLATELSNITFECLPPKSCKQDHYDVVICSEVLEHVNDYAPFFRQVIDNVNSDGIVIVTVPNGRGPFELQQALRRLVQKTRLYSFVKKKFQKDAQTSAAQSFLNSADVHVNFFRYGQLLKLFEDHGMKLDKYEGRTFLCGFCFTPLFIIPYMTSVNDWLGSVLPSWMVSDWMFVISKNDQSGLAGR